MAKIAGLEDLFGVSIRLDSIEENVLIKLACLEDTAKIAGLKDLFGVSIRLESIEDNVLIKLLLA